MKHDSQLLKEKDLKEKLDECQLGNQDMINLMMTLQEHVKAIHLMSSVEVTTALINPINQNGLAILRTVMLISLDALTRIEKVQKQLEYYDELPF